MFFILFFFSFKLERQDEKGLEILTLAAGICFKPSECDTILLLDKTKVPKPSCNWAPSYRVPG